MSTPSGEAGSDQTPAEPDVESGVEPGVEAGVEPEWKRRARLARIFGNELPDTTSDERDARDGAASGNDERLRRDVPPHHGS